MLENLKGILEQGAQFADSKKVEMEVLLNSRLAPDQFNLIKQIQIACDTAKLAVVRLTGKEAPTHADNEKNYSEIKTRIDSVLTYLNSVSANDFKDAEKKQISQPRWEGKYLFADEYIFQHALPNLYFHITTAYSILRHNGVSIGKKDYLGKMPYKN